MEPNDPFHLYKEMTMSDNVDNMARIEREIEKKMEADYE